jgi:hypothetical protein
MRLPVPLSDRVSAQTLGPGGAAQGGLDAAAGEAVVAAGVVGVEGRVGACSRGAQEALLLVCSIDNSLCK